MLSANASAVHLGGAMSEVVQSGLHGGGLDGSVAR